MNQDLRAAFCDLYNVTQPHEFQIEVAEHLLAGANVILQAPTGSGKTWNALFPFLYAWQKSIAFPRRCLYAVPLRVLATQFKEDATSIVARWPKEQRPPRICIQTGEQQDDPTFEQDLIFTTIDQVLSSALSVPYSLGHRRANLNAGAVFSSYLVCDELHLFPVNEGTAQGALPTLIDLLRTFGHALPFLLMTATLSTEMLKRLQDRLDAKCVTVPVDKLPCIGSQRKTRRYHLVDAPLSADAVLREHRNHSIVICNQVQRAINLYEDISKAVEAADGELRHAEVTLLHSRFVKEHRKEKEDTLRAYFGKTGVREHSTSSRIIVATQAIEVGLDISSTRLHTELAPANAIVQRAGRCARYEGEEGDVLIYQLPPDSTQPHLPYDAARCAATWEAFKAPSFTGRALTFTDEQAIVSRVHDGHDARLLDKIEHDSYSKWKDMSAAMFRGDTNGRARLIRQVDTRTILVHDRPELIRQPYAWRGFSLFHGTLRSWLQSMKEAPTDWGMPDWWLRYPVEVCDETEESRRRPSYDWNNRVHDPEQIHVSPIFVVHPELVAYDRWRGFRLRPAENRIDLSELNQEPPPSLVTQFQSARYNLEAYTDHIGRMLAYYRYQKLDQRTSYVARRLAATPGYDFAPEEFERAMLLALALHDVGKLQTAWQQWSHAYQAAIGEPVAEEKMIVHTHYRPGEQPHHAKAEERLKHLPRPHHAAEGAWAVWPIIEQALDGNEVLTRPVFTAIARHHAPWADSFQSYELHPEGITAIADALGLVGERAAWAQRTCRRARPLHKDGALEDQLIRDEDPVQWLVYALIVRTLRLCDGHSLEEQE